MQHRTLRIASRRAEWLHYDANTFLWNSKMKFFMWGHKYYEKSVLWMTEHMIDKVSEFLKLFLSSGCTSSEISVTLLQSAHMFSLPTLLLPQTMWCTLWTRCDTKSFHIKWNVFVTCMERAGETQLQSPFDSCLTNCTIRNLIFNKFSSSLHNPGNFNPSVHCTDLQFFRCHIRRCTVDSWMHLWALQISNPTDLDSSRNLIPSVIEAFISATHDG